MIFGFSKREIFNILRKPYIPFSNRQPVVFNDEDTLANDDVLHMLEHTRFSIVKSDGHVVQTFLHHSDEDLEMYLKEHYYDWEIEFTTNTFNNNMVILGLPRPEKAESED